MSQIQLGFLQNLARSAFKREREGDAVGAVVEQAANAVHSVAFTVNAEDSNAITVNCQASDVQGNDIEEKCAMLLVVVEEADPDTLNTTNYTSIAAGTDGDLIELAADKVLLAITEADGDLDVVVTLASGAATCYLLAIGLNGRIIGTSGAITHAA